MSVRPPFNRTKPLVAAREFTFAGDQYKKGDKFPRLGNAATFNPRLIARQYEAGAVNHRTEEEEAEQAVQIKAGPRNGSWTITAPWIETPEVIRGKQNADERYAELVDAGPPLGFIAGGSEVTVSDNGGGWFEVSAPWLDEPEKIQGRDAAEARQLVLHEGKPEDFQPQPDKDEGGAPEGGESTGGDQGGTETGGETGGNEGSAPEGGPEATEGGENAGGAENASGEATEASDGDGDRKGAEQVPGTGPAKAADDVEAAAGQAKGDKGRAKAKPPAA